MRIGVPKETAQDERRVALVPEVVRKLVGGGHEVVVEAGAGEQALLPDALYTDAGATIGDPYGADVIVRVAVPSDDEVARLRSGQILIGFLAPLTQARAEGAGCAPQACRRWRWSRSRASAARSRWTRSARRPTSAATRPRCWAPSTRRASTRC